MFTDALQRSCVFEGMVSEIGPVEQCFVDVRLRVRFQVYFFSQQMQRVLKRDIVGDVCAFEVCSNDFFVKGFPVVCDPSMTFAEGVRFPNGFVRS